MGLVMEFGFTVFLRKILKSGLCTNNIIASLCNLAEMFHFCVFSFFDLKIGQFSRVMLCHFWDSLCSFFFGFTVPVKKPYTRTPLERDGQISDFRKQ